MDTFILPIGAVLPECRLEKTAVNAVWIIQNAMHFNTNPRHTINLCGQAGAFLGELAKIELDKLKQSKKETQ